MFIELDIHFYITLGDKNSLKQGRLEYFLISDPLQKQIKTIEIIPSVLSDHSTLILKIGSILGRRQKASHIGSLTLPLFMTNLLLK